MRPRAADVVLGALALALFSGSVGLVRNRLVAQPLPVMAAWRAALPAGIHEVDLATAREYLEEGQVLFVDARELERYQQGHVPGALSLPAEDLEQYLQGRSRETLLATLSLKPMVLVYCDGPECQASGRLAAALVQAGVSQVRVMSAGWPAWEQAGNPVSREVAP